MQRILQFSVYEHSLVLGDNLLISRKFIVLKDNNKHIVAWTDFHRYIKSGKRQIARKLTDDGNMRHYSVCKLLNYVFFDKYHIKKLTELTVDMVKEYLNDYGMNRLPDDGDFGRTEATVNAHVRHIMDFLELLCEKNKCHFTKRDLYKEEKVFNPRRRKVELRKVPVFEVLYTGKVKDIFRDMPDGVFNVFLDVIIQKHKDILMLAALGAFAGMRPAECCNVRRTDSPLGAGIRFVLVDGEVTDVIIDLTKEQNLRSDLKPVGKIKKERRQKIYPAFLRAFYDCYQIYMNYIEGQKYEADYGALTVNKQGKALTYNSYYQKFKEVVSDVIPELLASNEPQLIDFAYQLQENNISPHIFRHWFSVQLTLRGEDVSGLMYWRGDKSPESALTYLQNKSDLVKQYAKVNEELFEYNMWKAGKKHD